MIHLVNGTGANAAVRPVTAPAPTMHFGARLNSVRWVTDEELRRIVERRAP